MSYYRHPLRPDSDPRYVQNVGGQPLRNHQVAEHERAVRREREARFGEAVPVPDKPVFDPCYRCEGPLGDAPGIYCEACRKVREQEGGEAA